jgi:hypothetical protein
LKYVVLIKKLQFEVGSNLIGLRRRERNRAATSSDELLSLFLCSLPFQQMGCGASTEQVSSNMQAVQPPAASVAVPRESNLPPHYRTITLNIIHFNDVYQIETRAKCVVLSRFSVQF